MDLISRYVTRDYLISFFLTLSVLTFVMGLGAVIKAVDLLARGISGFMIFRVFLTNLPYIVSFSIPVSCLVTVLLLFSRLSLDGEITAMRACGITLWHIVSGPVIAAILLAGVCLYLNAWLAPNSHFARRTLVRELGVEEPINLLEEGRFVRDFPDLMVYVGRKDDLNLHDVIVYELDNHGLKRVVRANSGTLRTDAAQRMLYVDLYEVRIDVPDAGAPHDMTRARHINAKHYPIKLDYEELFRRGTHQKNIRSMTLPELRDGILNVRERFPELQDPELRRQRLRIAVEANKRLALSLSCIAFTLIGIPLGLRSKRKESSIGIAMSLVVVIIFYSFLITADSLIGRPAWRPDLVVWIPVVCGQLIGLAMLRRTR